MIKEYSEKFTPLFSPFLLSPSLLLPASLLQGLWLGTSAGIMKTVPKYMTAVVVKDKVRRVGGMEGEMVGNGGERARGLK